VNHTPEPWSRNVSAKYPIYHEWTQPNGRRNNRKIAHVLGEDERAEADLRRIILCVNACGPDGEITRTLQAFIDLWPVVAPRTEPKATPEVLAAWRQAKAALALIRGESAQ